VTRAGVRIGLRTARGLLSRLGGPWRGPVVGVLVGVLGALAVEGFRALLFALEVTLVGARQGHLVVAARHLAPDTRLMAPAIGGLAAGLLLWLAERSRRPAPLPHGGDYIEAVVIGRGRLDLRGGALKVLASLLVVSTGGAVGREGAMVLLAAMLASMVGRLLARVVDLRLVVGCGAAAGLAAAYHAPLAGAVFVAEILFGSLALSQLGPVMVAAVMSYGVTVAFGERALLFPLVAPADIGVTPIALMTALGLVAGVVGAGLLHGLEISRQAFTRLALPLPVAFALGGLIVGLLSLWRPEVWGNGYSSIEQQLTTPDPWQVIALVLALKLLAIGATTGSGAPGGVFTPTLFVGATAGALAATALHALGFTQVVEPVYAVVGMATLLAATTHAPVMAALMVFEMTGQYGLLPALPLACVVATLVSQRLHASSVYGLDSAAPAVSLK
jgi:CIC family chloride channel protein